MTDIFNQKILCSDCNVRMKNNQILKNGIVIRAIQCPRCNKKILHPADVEEYKHFQDLKNKNFHVKLRIVGNSYAVSIPKEIIDFMHEQDKIMNDMVKLCFDDLNRLSLVFGKEEIHG